MNKILIIGLIVLGIGVLVLPFIASFTSSFTGLHAVDWLYYIALITILTGGVLTIMGIIKHFKKMSYYKK